MIDFIAEIGEFQPFLRFWAKYFIYRSTGIRLVSTLLEILDVSVRHRGECRPTMRFQPFLRFWWANGVPTQPIASMDDVFQPFLRFWLWFSPPDYARAIFSSVSTLLEILVLRQQPGEKYEVCDVSTLLEILAVAEHLHMPAMQKSVFQPFLRFWGLCVWFLWVFKFFFGFL